MTELPWDDKSITRTTRMASISVVLVKTNATRALEHFFIHLSYGSWNIDETSSSTINRQSTIDDWWASCLALDLHINTVV